MQEPSTDRPVRHRLGGIGAFAAAAVVPAPLILTPLACPPAARVIITTLASARAPGAASAQELLNGRQLRIMAPAAPGGGWDQTAREMQAALRTEAGRTEVYNVAGAGGTIGLSPFL